MSRLQGIARGRLSIRSLSLLGCGLVLAMSAPLDGAQAKSITIYSFKGGAKDGSLPSTGLAVDQSGNLYGTANYGGGTGCGGNGCGILFELTGQNGAWSETKRYTFTGGNDGALPVSDPRMTWDTSGNLYGTASSGGKYGYGTVFVFNPGTGTYKVFYTFMGGNDGANPWGAPILDKKGNLYGTTTAGGTNGAGTVYELAPDGTEKWVYSFGAGTDGQFPADGLIALQGNFYGTTQNGGANGDGMVFKITPDGGETPLYNFTGGNDGAQPAGALIVYKGNLYGTARAGGLYGVGTVFEVTPDGGETTLYPFTGGSDGGAPYSTLISNKGNLYGTTEYGGDVGLGTVFKLSPSNGGWTEKPLHSFRGGRDGNQPYEGVILNTDGNLYGTTAFGGGNGCGGSGCGTVFGLPK